MNGAFDGPVAKFLAAEANQQLGTRRRRARAVRRRTGPRVQPGAGSRSPGRRAAHELDSGIRIQVFVGDGFSDVRARPRDRRARRRAPSVHLADARRHAVARQRAGARAGAGVRLRVQRERAGRREHPRERSSSPGARSSRCSASTRRRPPRGSGSCSRDCAPGRRRTAASRSGSTGSRCSSPAPGRCAT